MWLFYLPSIASYNIKIIANSRRKSKPLKQLFWVNFVSYLTVLGWQNLSCEKKFQPQKKVRHLSPPLWIHWKTSQSISQKGIHAKLRLLSHCLAFHVVQRFSRSVLTRLSRSTRQCLDQKSFDHPNNIKEATRHGFHASDITTTKQRHGELYLCTIKVLKNNFAFKMSPKFLSLC